MGLLSILRKIKEKEREMRIIILGLDNAGKIELYSVNVVAIKLTLSLLFTTKTTT